MAQLAAKKSMSATVTTYSAEFIFRAMLQFSNELMPIPHQYKWRPEVGMGGGNRNRILRRRLRLLSLTQLPDAPASPACEHVAASFAPNKLQLRLPQRFHFVHRLKIPIKTPHQLCR